MNYGAVGATRFAGTKGRINGSFTKGINYPSPFFDIGHTYMPTTVKQMFQWCRYYFLVHPLINSVVFKLSLYPITDLVYNTDNKHLKNRWREMLEENLRYRCFMGELGLDFYTYGNGLVSIFYPFKKKLKCTSCGEIRSVKDATYYYRNYQFHWQCPKCGHHGPAKVFDEYIRSPKGIRLLRWNPEDVEITYNDTNGKYTYYYNIPVQLKNDIIMGKKSVVEEVPQVFIEALKRRKAVIFSQENLYHFRRPTLAGKDRGWGIPLLLPVLKDTYYLQILKKSQEAIALEHIVPLRVLYPQAASATSDPFTTINLEDWKDQISEEIQRWRFDNNYIPILPLPIGNQTIGGDGRALMLTQEVRFWSEQIVMGMGVPVELVFGGLSFTGSNVSLRMLENTFIGYLTDHVHLLNWVVRNISSYLDWDPLRVHFKPFKMADDLQRKAYNFQLNQAGKISDDTLLNDSDFDPEREDELIKQETDRRAEAQKKAQLAQAEIQGESQMIMMRYQLKAQAEQQQMMMSQQPAPGEPGAEAEGVQPEGMSSPVTEGQAAGAAPLPQQTMPPQAVPPIAEQARAELPPAVSAAESPLRMAQQSEGGEGGGQNVDLLAQAQRIAQYLLQLDENSRTMALMNMRQQNPEFYQVVLGLMQNMMSGGRPETSAAKPLPEQQAPQRGPESAIV